MREAAAVAATNPYVPAAVRVGIASMVDELLEQRQRIADLELAILGGARGHG